VREPQEVYQFTVPGALSNPMSSFAANALPMGTGKKLVFVCAHGMRSRQVGQYLLQENIIPEAYNMTGGVAAWVQAGFSDQS